MNRRMRHICSPTTSPSWSVNLIREVTKWPTPSAVCFSSETFSITSDVVIRSPMRSSRWYFCSQFVATTEVNPAFSSSVEQRREPARRSGGRRSAGRARASSTPGASSAGDDLAVRRSPAPPPRRRRPGWCRPSPRPSGGSSPGSPRRGRRTVRRTRCPSNALSGRGTRPRALRRHWLDLSSIAPDHAQAGGGDDLALHLVHPAAERVDLRRPVAALDLAVQDRARLARARTVARCAEHARASPVHLDLASRCRRPSPPTRRPASSVAGRDRRRHAPVEQLHRLEPGVRSGEIAAAPTARRSVPSAGVARHHSTTSS